MKIAIIQPTGEVLRCGEDWGKHLQTFARTGSLDFVEVCWPQPRSNTPSRRTERLDPFKAAKHYQPTSKNRL
jgi:hypothetical protein